MWSLQSVLCAAVVVVYMTSLVAATDNEPHDGTPDLLIF